MSELKGFIKRPYDPEKDPSLKHIVSMTEEELKRESDRIINERGPGLILISGEFRLERK